MRPGNPWSVKGIQPATRQAAKEAARRHGMTLGQWLNHVILDSSEGADDSYDEQLRARQQPGLRQELNTPELVAASASKPHHIQEKIEDIAARLDAVFDRSSNQVDLDQWEAEHPRSSRGGDLAVRTVTHQERAREARQHPPAPERFATRKPDGLDDRLSALASKLDNIVEAREISKSHSDQGLNEVDATLRKVITHIETSDRQNSDVMKSIQARLSELSSRTTASNNDVVQQLSGTVGDMERRLSHLSQRVLQTEASAEEIPGFEEQINILNDRLDASLNRETNPQIQALEERTSQLSAQLNDILQTTNAPGANDQNEVRFEEISKQLKATEQQYLRLSALEDSGNQLFDAVDQDRTAARENTLNTSQKAIQTMETMVDQAAQKAVENAAQRSAEHVAAIMADDGLNKKEISASIAELRDEMHKLQETTITTARRSAEEAISAGAGSRSSGNMTEPVKALRQKFDQLQDSSRSAELQNQDTLEAVHDTLEKVVERLVTLETSPLQTDNLSAPGAAVDNPGIDVEDDLETGLEPEPKTTSFEPASPVHWDRRIDPIFGAPDSEENTSEKAGAGSSSPALNQNYLEAARRAAQAASLSPKNLAGDGEGKKADEGDGSQSKNSILAMATEGNKKRKTLLLTAAAVLLVIGALSAASLIGDRAPNIANSSTGTPAATASKDRLTDNAAKRNRQTPESNTAKSPKTAKPAISPVSQNTSRPAASTLKVTDNLLTQSNFVDASNINSPTPPKIVTSAATLSELTGAKQEKRPRSPVKVARLNAAAPAVLNDAMAAQPVEPLPPEAIGPMALRRAAALGNATAQFEIASRYTTGKLVAQNLGKAISWYQKAAAQGLAPAQYILGTFYEKGRGVAKDKTAARIWYERAAMKGNLKAIHNLAVIYADGGKGKPDFTKAGIWFRKAAEFGLADSQFNLAILHDRGLGVSKDSSKAYFWFQIASKQGDGDARTRAEAIEKRMTADEIAGTRLLINNWRPATLSQKANEVVLPADGWQRPAQAAQVGGDATFNQQQLVILAQGYLTRLGFNPGPADGVLGTQTRQAIKDFQQQHQLPVSGNVDPTLVSNLKAATG